MPSGKSWPKQAGAIPEPNARGDLQAPYVVLTDL